MSTRRGYVLDVRGIASAYFCGDVPLVLDFGERAAHVGPINLAVADVLPLEFAVRAIELEVLQVHFDDARAERADPVLRIAVEDDVADVEIGLQPRGVELVDVARELERAEEELVPDLFDRDDDLELARQRQQPLFDDTLRTLPRLPVGGGGIDDRRHEQDGIGAPERGIAQRGLHARNAALHDLRVIARERGLPVSHVHDGVDAQSRLFRCLVNLRGHLGLRDRLHLDAVEARLASDLEALGEGHLLGKHRNQHGLADCLVRGCTLVFRGFVPFVVERIH